MYQKLKACKFCEESFVELSSSQRANHTRWCLKNPKAQANRDALVFARSHVVSTSEMQEKIKQAHRDGKYDYSKLVGRTYSHTEESKKKISDGALKSKHRRLRKSVRDYVRTDGTLVKLDSSWEEILAKRLDEQQIDWVRPEIPIEWSDASGKVHNYFPDFYLPKFDVFLDPKNPFARSTQKEKIDILVKQIPNLVILKTEDECRNFLL